MFPKDTNTMKKKKKKHGTGPITETSHGKPLCTIPEKDEAPQGEAAPLVCANKRIKSGHAISPK